MSAFAKRPARARSRVTLSCARSGPRAIVARISVNVLPAVARLEVLSREEAAKPRMSLAFTPFACDFGFPALLVVTFEELCSWFVVGNVTRS